ncbi:uncharacterized protein A1O9_09316 [Exophiala aquamarina CBS 119918]|uniref:Rhodopsin domain-containing protein n=1 Tax=Exophiala aquamarina CBS 119918 TaxID=1182545 RepID=A0A072P6H1_9EURO|nr:uncharacterized protein A1O9_09316 [Exophiala aquamarina CBS 119918]KEF54873.1 hypothetical protein A1O9_09316 [Exophiala aquamarina CBS 119918]
MSDTGEGNLYEPLKPPFEGLTPDNRGPIALATAATIVVITGLTVGVKLWTRLATIRTMGANDIAILVAMTICIGLATDKGLGRHIDAIPAADLPGLSKTFYASNILMILAIAGAKAAVTLLVIAIKPLRNVMYGCYGMLVFIGLWTVASVFALAFQCSPNRWALGPSESDTCVNQYAMQVAIRSLDIASDVGIVLLPALMMRTVLVSRDKRWMVIMLFSLRLATPCMTAASIVALDDFYHSAPQDRTWFAITPSVWTSVAMNVSIVTACIPSIKRFLADWASGLSNVAISEPFELEHSAGKSGGFGSYAPGSGMGSKIATRLGLSSTSKAQVTSHLQSVDSHHENNHSQLHANNNRGVSVKANDPNDASDSVKGLTDGVIMHSIDYRVEYEEQNTDHRDWHSSSSNDRI